MIRTRSRRLLILLLVGASFVEARTTSAWGFTGHRLVNRKAISTLPAPLRDLFTANAAYVEEHAIDPDLWRAEGRPAEGPNHFLDLDAFGEAPFPDVSHVEAEYVARFGQLAKERGRVPWRVAELYREMVAAFRARDAARTLTAAALLGHYVGDAHVPLHAVVNHDGQLTGQNGVHARWESGLVDRFERQIEPSVQPAAAKRVADPVALVFEALLASYDAAGQVLAADRELAGPHDYAETAEDDRYDDRYYSRFYEREGGRVRARLTAAAEAVGSLWYSAWEDAGRPPVDSAFRFPYVRRQNRLVLLTLDGAAAPVVDDAVARGIMPNLARLRQEGTTAAGSVTSLPAKTAPGHATLFTGAWPDRHGIAGNRFARGDATVLDGIDGYRSDGLRAEPLWATAARQGLAVTTLAATQTYPFAPYEGERRFGGNLGRDLTMIQIYQGPAVSDAVYEVADLGPRDPAGWTGSGVPLTGAREVELRIESAPVVVHGLLFDDPDDPRVGFDTLYLSADKNTAGGIRVKPAAASGKDDSGFAWLDVPVPGAAGGFYFRLFALEPDGSSLLLYRSEGRLITSNRPLVPAVATKALGGLAGNGASRLYRAGALGPPLWRGGDGTAERRYLETARLVARGLGRLADFAAKRTRWDMLVGYLPYPDEALHLWLGYLEPTFPEYDAARAARLRLFLDDVLRLADDYVGTIVSAAGPDAIVAVGADHGMLPFRRHVRFNVLLEKSGLLARDSSGAIDLPKTRVVYSPGNSGYFQINRAARPGGIVPLAEEASVRRALIAALRGLRDPETGRAVVTAIRDPERESGPFGLVGAAAGDLYFDLAPGYYPSPSLEKEVFKTVEPMGEHLLSPERREMQASFLLSGPGVAKGAALGVIRQIDIAPTLTTLLGLDPPAQAEGRAVSGALAHPLPELVH